MKNKNLIQLSKGVTINSREKLNISPIDLAKQYVVKHDTIQGKLAYLQAIENMIWETQK